MDSITAYIFTDSLNVLYLLNMSYFVIHTNPIHGYMYYSHVGNNIYTHYTSKDTTKQYGKLENY